MPLPRRLAHPLLVLAVAAAAAGCTDDPTPLEPAAIEDATFASSLGVNLGTSTRTANGLYYRDLVVGTGAVVTVGQFVTVRYAGALTNGRQFDATDPGETYEFRLGVGEVIAGWDQGVAGMRVGGRRQLVIPPALGYGFAGRGPIPGNAILVFTVEVVSVR